MYLKKGSGVCRIEADGEGRYHGPASGRGFETVCNIIHPTLVKQGGMYDVRGLIWGPNSPFKNKYPHSWYDFVILPAEKKLYTLNIEIDETDG